MEEKKYRNRLIILIAVTFLLRLITAASFELSNTEVYYWVFSNRLQWNYFDHPPMVAWLIRLTTLNGLLTQEIFVRLGAILSSAVCTWLVYKIGSFLKDRQTGWFAALLYSCSIYASFGAGTAILPDSPQLVFWLSSILVLLKIINSTPDDKQTDKQWVIFGLLAGLCIMSKVHGVFIWFGLGLYVTFIDRNWLKSRGIYLAAFITFIIISPILIWNIQNDFATFHFHTSRVSLVNSTMQLPVFLKSMLAVILTTNPINFVLIFAALFAAFSGKLRAEKKNVQLIVFTFLPLVVTVFFISLFRETLPNWPGPGYVGLLFLPAIQLSTAYESKKSSLPTLIKIAIAYAVVTTALQIAVINYFPGTISTEKEGYKMGNGDDTLDMYGWKEAGDSFDSLYRSDVAGKKMPVGSPLIVTNWHPAAHLDYYFARKTKQETIGIGPVSDLHEYYWLNRYKQPLKAGDNAYYIVPSNQFSYHAFSEVVSRFKHHELAGAINEVRSGLSCKDIFVFRLIGYVPELK